MIPTFLSNYDKDFCPRKSAVKEEYETCVSKCERRKNLFTLLNERCEDFDLVSLAMDIQTAIQITSGILRKSSITYIKWVNS